jgi:transcriptional regulator with XRE-family HTH domain
VKRTIGAMQQGLGKAVADLRIARGWNQSDLASEIARGARTGASLKPTQDRISRWETGEAAPSQEYRAALARIAANDKRSEHLAELFRAPVSAWRLVGLICPETNRKPE